MTPDQDKDRDAKIAVVRDFYNPVKLHFPLPATVNGADEDETLSNQKSFLRLYIDAMKQYPQAVLEKAAKEIIRTRTINSFPMVSECLDVCERVYQGSHLRKSINNQKTRYPEWDHERVIMANKLMNCDLGRQACEEGWQVALWDFLRENQRLPDVAESGRIRGKSLEQWRQTEQAMKADGGVARMMRSMHETFQKRRALLKKVAHGELPPSTRIVDLN